MKKWEERESIVLENQGQKIFGVLHTPHAPPNSQYPAVLFCHGFAGNKCGKFRLYVRLAQLLTQLGVAALRIDFRGSGDSEGDLLDMTLEGEVEDALIALQYLNRHPLIDANRLGIFGRSLGGMVAIIAASKTLSIKSLALWAPVFDAKPWEGEWNKTQEKLESPMRSPDPIVFHGFATGEPFVKEIFTVNLEKHLEKVSSIPLLHIHGKKDKMIHIRTMDQYRACRKSVSGKTHFLTLPNSDHDFSYLPEQKKALEETAKWFQETLGSK